MRKKKIPSIITVCVLIMTLLISVLPEFAYASEEADATIVTVTYTAGTGGSVSNTREEFLLENAGLIKGSTAMPSEGWQFSHWERADGSTISTDAHLLPEISTGAANYSYKAVFQEIPAAFAAEEAGTQVDPAETKNTSEKQELPLGKEEAEKEEPNKEPSETDKESTIKNTTSEAGSQSEEQGSDTSGDVEVNDIKEKKENSDESESAVDEIIKTEDKESGISDPRTTGESDTQKTGKEIEETEAGTQTDETDKGPTGDWLFDEYLGDIHVIVKAARAAFPAGTIMKLSPVSSDMAAEAVMESTDLLVKDIAAVDITFVDSRGNEIKPTEAVNVTISSSIISGNNDPVVVHIDDKGACDKQVILEETEQSVTIEAIDFSIYAVAYTVDFHYKNLSFSIAGKSSILLSELIRMLGIELDLSFVENVVFSNSDLVGIAKAGDDWLLTSLIPFTSKENLRIVLLNGSEINIAVTDAQDASAYFHADITSNKETYASGSTAIYSVKYTIDRGNIHEGDYIYVTIPSDLISSADLSVSSQHFSSVENLGNGQYKLTFGAGAESALTGSFSMFLTTDEVEEQQTGPITVGNDSSSITVNPKGPSGTGVYTDTIQKDAADNGSAVLYGDYDYSEGYGDSAAQIGILTSNPGSIKYRLYVNNKEAEINNVVVTDVLPDGMVFDLSKSVEVTDRNTGQTIDSGLYSVSLSGNTLTFSYPGTLSTAPQINYWVNLVSSKPLAGKYTNRADITYEQEGAPYAEHRNYILQGSDYSAANGEKSVDKTEISTDPDDQLVTYTIKFWNQSGFSAGEIVLDDILDPYVHFISATSIEYFSIEQDEDDPQIIHLENIEDISGTTTVYVRFICDFSDVPVGYTVDNILGGNITKTRKTGGEAVLSASKTVDGNSPASDQIFDFELLDSSGNILQTKQNSGADVSFDAISYGKDDLGKTYTYQIREKADQDTDYVIDGTVYTVLVAVASEADEDGIINTAVTYQKNGTDVDKAAFNNTSAKIEIPVAKVWEDSGNQDGIRPNEVTMKLLANDEDTGKTLVLNEGNHWAGSFTELDQYSGGNEIVYTIKEVEVSGYTPAITGTQVEGYTVTNSHTPETTEVSGSKTWNDNNNQDGARPESITVRLLADGTEVDSKTVTADDEWKWTFTGLPKNKEGRTISYSVKEDAVTGYSTEYSGTDVVNNYTPKKTSLTVTKAWEDSEDQDGIRPNEVTVKLLANDEDTGKTLLLNEGNHWAGSFTELDQYSGGNEIVYTIEEVEVSGYTPAITGTQVEGYTVTNSHTPETTEVSGSKTWNDNNNQDGARPESITVRLLADGTEVDSKTVTAADDWTWTFTDLPKNKEGRTISYSVKEDVVAGYSTEYNGTDVINNYSPKKTSVTVTKGWNDSENQDGIRSDEVTIKLLADGEDTGKTLVLNEGNHWAGSFTELDQYSGGNEIVYTIEEVEVSGYTTVITGTQVEGYTVTNSHTPETTEVSGSKTWNDNNNQDGARPESITVRLLADGMEVDSKKVTAADGWKWSFTNLPKNKEGKTIDYSITEDAVEKYSSEIKGYNITNTHTPSSPKSGYKAIKSSDTTNQEVKPGDRITYKITIQNTGDTKLTGIWIRDYIPEYTKYISAGQNGERGAIDGKQHVDWFITSLDAGQSTQVTFTVEVVTCIPDNTTIRNTAYTQDTENPGKPSLNKPDNPKDKTNEIVHYYKPDKSSAVRGSGPKTGDDSNMIRYVLTMILSGLAAVLLVKRKKKA